MAITLRAARVNKALTQAEAAKKIGVEADTLRKWERGESFPKVPQIQKIEEVYDVSYNDLIFLTQTSV